jgi:O-antigen ligase
VIHRLRLGVIPVYLVLCLLLGGASAAGFWLNLSLQLLALPIIVWSIATEPGSPTSAPARRILALLLLLTAIFVIQLIPLPPSIWTHLPGRADVAAKLLMAGAPLHWAPISLDRYRTVASAVWLLPATAVLLGILRLGAFRASWLAWVLAAVSVASIIVGALQVVGGEGSTWYFYAITNVGTSVGFFANANHLAILMVSTIPFLAALYLAALRHGGSLQKSSGLFIVLVGTLIVSAVGIAVNGSIAGIGLSVPVLGASLLMIVTRKRRLPLWAPLLIALLFAGSAAAVFTGPFDNNLTTASQQGKEDSRYTSFKTTLPAVKDYFPVGSGIGTFQQIYRTREDPAKVDRFYMNHVHGDYLEVALEAGLPGIIAVLLFLLWWGARVVATWRAEQPDYFARAATITSAAILAHSLVDYPLRTAAISAVFAMCCALMAEPRTKTRVRGPEDGERGLRARHLSAD